MNCPSTLVPPCPMPAPQSCTSTAVRRTRNRQRAVRYLTAAAAADDAQANRLRRRAARLILSHME